MNVAKCAAQKSQKTPELRCPHPASHGLYCGIHYKSPRPWIPPAVPLPPNTTEKNVGRVEFLRSWLLQCMYRQHGPAWTMRSLCTNTTDVYSMDALCDIPLAYFVSYIDAKGHVYGFDVRSVHAMLNAAADDETAPCNPYTRTEFPAAFLKKVAARIARLRRAKRPVDWVVSEEKTTTASHTGFVVDTFCAINNLGYYTSPDWFIGLNLHAHRRLYAELYRMWHMRTPHQRRRIVPLPTEVFKTVPTEVLTMSLEAVAALNIHTISTLVSSAARKDDCSIGAIDVLSALTLVCMDARRAYPWFYEDAVQSLQPVPLAMLPMGGAAVGTGGMFGRLVNYFLPMAALGNAYRM